MSIKANKTVIGAFVVGAVVLLVLAFAVLGSGKFFTESNHFVLFFDGTVKGLNLGAPVIFRGVKLGMVRDISLEYLIEKKIFRIEVIIEIFENKLQFIGDMAAFFEDLAGPDATLEQAREKFTDYLIQDGLRAQLVIQSMVTGQLQVQLDLHEKQPLNLVGVDHQYPELPTIPTDMEKILGSLEKVDWKGITDDLEDTMAGLNRLVNSKELKETVESINVAMENIEGLTVDLREAYKPMKEHMEDLMVNANKLIVDVDEQVEPLSKGMDETMADARKLMNDVDAQVEPMAASLDETLEDARGLLQNADEEIEPIAKRLEETLVAARDALKSADATLIQLEGLGPERSSVVYEFRTTLEALKEALNSVKVLASYIERHPESLLHGKSGD